jgi:hypothetical protein
MIKRLALFALLACCAGFAQTTTFTANTKDLATVLPATPEAGPVYLELTLRNCAGSGTTPTIPHVNGTGVVVFPVNLYPDGTGLISKTVYDQTFIVCGSSAGVGYYHIRVYQGDNTRSLVKKLLFEDDFDVQGASFNLNSATPRSGSVITPPVATAVLTNPAGNQTIVQPGGTALSVNHLSAGFAQNANGADMIPANRFTDTSPTGNFLNFKNAALSTSLWQVDVTGQLLAGIIPNARLLTPAATGTGTTNTIAKYTNGATPVIGNSSITDNGTTVSTAEAVSAASLAATGGATVGTTLGVTGTSTLADVNLGAANTLSASNVKQVSATTAFCIRDNLGVCHLFIAGSTPFTNLFLQGNGAGSVFLGSAAKTSVADTTGIIVMSGATSGTTALSAAAVAGSGTLTFPGGLTDQLVSRTSTDTLTNKTITNLGITGGATNANLRFNGSAQVINGNTTDDGTNFSTGTVKLQVQSGVTQGSGFKHQRFGSLCTTTATAGANCTTAVAWTSAFADANYTVSCTGVTATNAPVLTVESIAAAGFTIRIFAVVASVATFSLADCIAAHD